MESYRGNNADNSRENVEYPYPDLNKALQEWYVTHQEKYPKGVSIEGSIEPDGSMSLSIKEKADEE